MVVSTSEEEVHVETHKRRSKQRHDDITPAKPSRGRQTKKKGQNQRDNSKLDKDSIPQK